MRQVMPHRNNIELRRTKSKRYFSTRWKNRFPPVGSSQRSAGAQAGFAGETAVQTGISMKFSGFDGRCASSRGYTRYADFAGARA